MEKTRSSISKYAAYLFIIFILIIISYSIYYIYPSFGPSSTISIDKISLPSGFEIELYASNLPGARSMAMGDNGVIFVGTRSEGKVYAVIDTDRDNIVEEKKVLLDGLDTPNGVAYKDGILYVAEVNRILKYEDIINQLDLPPAPIIIKDDYPQDKSHGWKYIAIGPDNKLYVPVGAPCNICAPEDDIYSSITRMNLDGSEFEIFAEGVRNTVGFDWHPNTQELFFTDNGRDWMGNDIPPDELNYAPQSGMHFGFPYCHGTDIADNEFGGDQNCFEYVAPFQTLGPHVAALGMKFYTGKMFPEEYRNSIFIAEHGSWNRTDPIGYRITNVKIDGRGQSMGYEVFAEGWLQEISSWGRPVDVLILDDGSLLVSDDKAGVIYRVSYK